MASTLIITPVTTLQRKINAAVKQLGKSTLIYISLNKPKASIAKIFKKQKVRREIFYVDDFDGEEKEKDALHVHLDRLDLLNAAIKSYITYIPGKKVLVIDSLSTLLIYNSSNKVAQFIKGVTSYASRRDVQVIAFSPHTKAEALLEKVYNFFDEVKKSS